LQENVARKELTRLPSLTRISERTATGWRRSNKAEETTGTIKAEQVQSKSLHNCKSQIYRRDEKSEPKAIVTVILGSLSLKSHSKRVHYNKFLCHNEKY